MRWLEVEIHSFANTVILAIFLAPFGRHFMSQLWLLVAYVQYSGLHLHMTCQYMDYCLFTNHRGMGDWVGLDGWSIVNSMLRELLVAFILFLVF